MAPPAEAGGTILADPANERLFVVGKSHVYAYSSEGRLVTKSAQLAGGPFSSIEFVLTDRELFLCATERSLGYALDAKSLRIL